MGIKPASSELASAIIPLFSHIKEIHVIQDDIIIANKTKEAHLNTLELFLQIILQSGLTLNKDKCELMKTSIKFWGMIINKDGIKPDPKKFYP